MKKKNSLRLPPKFAVLLRCSTHPAPRTLAEAHISRRSSVFRNTSENVGRQAASGRQPRDRSSGAESLAEVLVQCASVTHLNLDGNHGAESLAKVLAQCQALGRLDVWNDKIGDAVLESLAGVLAQCHLCIFPQAKRASEQ